MFWILFTMKARVNACSLTGTFPSLCMRDMVKSTTAGAVAGPGATSTRGMIWGGANQWAITRRSGLSSSANSKMSSPEVLLAITVCGGTGRTQLRKDLLLDLGYFGHRLHHEFRLRRGARQVGGGMNAADYVLYIFLLHQAVIRQHPEVCGYLAGGRPQRCIVHIHQRRLDARLGEHLRDGVAHDARAYNRRSLYVSRIHHLPLL